MRKFIIRAVCFLMAAAVMMTGSAAHAAITENMVREEWRRVSRAAGMNELPLTIKEEKEPNAWVTAGESVTVTTGLMNLLQKREEIFGVLSHEAGHAKLGHHESKIKNAVEVSLAAALLGKLIGDDTIGRAIIGAGANLATAGYSREQEVEADDFAIDLAFIAGEDPTGLYTALQKLSSYGKTSPSGFNSHPPDERRLLHLKNRILEKNRAISIP